MSITLFKTTLKKNWILLLIFISVLLLYTLEMTLIYDPENMEALTSMLKVFPEELMKAMGFSDLVTDLTAYLASWLYGMLMFAFPMIYCIILGNKLVAKTVDNGSISYLLSTPNSRVKIIVTQGIYAILSVAVLFTALFSISVLICEAKFPDLLDIGAYFKLNVTTMLVNTAVMMVTFFFSCLFNDSKYSFLFGAGIPIMFLLMNMLGGISKDAEFLKKISIYGWYDPVKLVRGKDYFNLNMLFIGIIIVLFIASVLVFKRKRLPI
ncbi:MAG: ABC transporter permease subunit [Oscillospiraceae bacterium]|nr:ABC transporter permease subunit [Oscillospiraceae bacterium]